MKWVPRCLAAIVAMSAPAGAEILIGVAAPLSGQYAVLGTQLRVGAETAVSAVNASGGVNGEMLSVLSVDDACDTRKAVDAARNFVARDVRLVVGHYCSGASSAAALVYKESGIVMISPTASQSTLTDAGNWSVLRMTGRDDAAYEIAARRILSEPGPPKAAIINANSPQSELLIQSAVSVLPSAMKIAVRLGTFNSTEVAQQIVDNAVERVIVALPAAEAAALVSSLLYAGFQGEAYGAEQFLSEEFAAGASDVQFAMSAVFPRDPMAETAATSVIRQYQLAGVTPEGATLPAHAAVQVFAAAASASSVNDGPAMARWLKSGKPIDTVLGQVSFDAKGDLTPQPFAWYRWRAAERRFLPE